jgi:hypothetical protein
MSLFARLIFVYRHKIIFWYRDFDYKRQEKAEKKRYLLQKHECEIAEKIRQEEQAAQQKSDEERRERIKAQQARDEQLLLKKEAEKLQKMDEEAAKVKKMLDDSFDFYQKYVYFDRITCQENHKKNPLLSCKSGFFMIFNH